MIERIQQGKVIWINLKNPTSVEVKKVMTELELPPSLMNDLTAPIPKNYASLVDDVIKVVLDFPVIKKVGSQHPYEVKFLIRKHCLLTVQYEDMGGMDSFKRQLEVSTTLRKLQKNFSGADLFFSLVNHLYVNTSLKLDYLETKLSDIESEIFNNNEKKVIYALSDTGNKLISFKHILSGHQEIFNDLQTFIEKKHKKHFDTELSNLNKHFYHLTMQANTLSEVLTALRDTNTAKLTTNQNEVMKIFTIMAFVTFPLSLVSSMFGMNTVATPLVGSPWDFWIILGIMLFATLCFFIFFKHKNWI